ncbi:MAG: hypothetical protein K2I68_02335 [Bacteroidales bacterium]|nr:hypothetical protein [Bacteroidales bacterium]
MKKNAIKSGLAVIFGILFFLPVKAQGPALTEYFLPGYNQRHWLNPALMPQFGYFNFPALGMVGVNVQSNFGLNSLFYPLDNGKMGTFLHPDVPADEALSGFHKNNYVNVNTDISLLSWGWYEGTSFWSVDLSAHVHADMNLPYEAFEFLKLGMTGDPTEYYLKNVGLNAQAYVSLALGHARAITPEWHVGGKFKFLYSPFDVSGNFPKTDLLLSGDIWRIRTNGSGQMHGIVQPVVVGDSVSGFEGGNAGRDAGYGIAFDLGFEYRPNYVSGLRFSFALTDLGFITYRRESGVNLDLNGNMVYDGMQISTDGSGEMNFDMDLGVTASVPERAYTRALFARMNAGVEYDFYLDMFSVGLLSSTYLNWHHVTTELTASINMKLLKWLSLSVSYSFLKTRQTIGWALNITPKYGMNFFFASDYTPLAFSRIKTDGSGFKVPARQVNAQFMFGISFPMGRNVMVPERGGTYEAWLIENGLYTDEIRQLQEPRQRRRDRKAAVHDTVYIQNAPVDSSYEWDGVWVDGEKDTDDGIWKVTPDEPTGVTDGDCEAALGTGEPAAVSAAEPVGEVPVETADSVESTTEAVDAANPVEAADAPLENTEE